MSKHNKNDKRASQGSFNNFGTKEKSANKWENKKQKSWENKGQGNENKEKLGKNQGTNRYFNTEGEE